MRRDLNRGKEQSHTVGEMSSKSITDKLTDTKERKDHIRIHYLLVATGQVLTDKLCTSNDRQRNDKGNRRDQQPFLPTPLDCPDSWYRARTITNGRDERKLERILHCLPRTYKYDRQEEQHGIDTVQLSEKLTRHSHKGLAPKLGE